MRYYVFFVLVLFSLICNAQKLQQEQSFKWESSVASNECEVDANGNPCALIIVELPLDDVEFECDYLVGEPKRTATGYEMWVIPSENKYLRISHSDFYSLKIQLVDSDDEKFKGRECYHTIILFQEKEVEQSESFVKISTNVKSRCTILIEGDDFVEECETTDEGILNFKKLSLGKYKYVVRANGYEEKEGMFELKDVPIEENVHLEINHIASVSDTSDDLLSVNRVPQSSLNQNEFVEQEVLQERTSFVKFSTNVRRKCIVLVEGEDGFCEKYETGNNGVLEYKKLPIGKYRYVIRADGYKDGEGVFELKDIPLEKEVRLAYDGNYGPKSSVWDSHTIYYARPRGERTRTSQNIREKESQVQSSSPKINTYQNSLLRKRLDSRKGNLRSNSRQATTKDGYYSRPQQTKDKDSYRNQTNNSSQNNVFRKTDSQKRKVFRQQVEGKSRTVNNRNTTNRYDRRSTNGLR